MTEEKDIFAPESVNENQNIQSENTNNVGDVNMSNQPVQAFEPVNNAFLYSSSPIQYTTVPTETVTVENQSVDNLQEVTNKTEVVVEQVKPVETVEANIAQVQNTEEKTVEKVDVKEDSEMMDKDLKGNLTFIIVLAIIMVAIVVALPYISGYN